MNTTDLGISPGPLRRWLAFVLLAGGLLAVTTLFFRPAGRLWIVYLTVGPWGPTATLVVFALAAAGACWKPLREFLGAGRPADFRTSLVLALGAGAFLTICAWSPQRQLFPYVQDESSYLIQAHQLARGRLWYPAHPLGASFDSFQLLTRGAVYASAYFPGTALLYVPGIWLGVPPFVTSLVIAASVAGLLHWLVSRCLDQSAGTLAVVLLLAVPMFRILSTMVMGQLPLLLYSLAAFVAWARWYHGPGAVRWALLAGAMIGLAALTRPVDALSFGLPLVVGSALLCSGTAVGRRRLMLGTFAFTAGILPMAIVQLICNRDITGNTFETPFRLYADLDYPDSAYGFHPFHALTEPASPLPQKRMAYDDDVRPLIEAHRPSRFWGDLVRMRLPLLLSFGGATSPFPLLASLWPAAFATASRRAPLRAMLLSTPLLFLILYVPYPFFFPHYMTAAAPGLLLGFVLAVCGLPLLLPRHGKVVRTFGALGVAMLGFAAFPQFNSAADNLFAAPLLKNVNAQLAGIHSPAIVLFRYSPTRNVDEEPVYNADVAWPDDAPVIRAHDLGPVQNAVLFRYYAAREPDRHVFIYDEADHTLVARGPVSALAAAIIR